MQSQTLKNLYHKVYNNRFNPFFSLEVKFKEYNDTFTLDLINIHDKLPDCCIGHFGYNFYFRTNKGILKQQYKTFINLKKAIKQKAQKLGLTFENILIQRGHLQKILN